MALFLVSEKLPRFRPWALGFLLLGLALLPARVSSYSPGKIYSLEELARLAGRIAVVRHLSSQPMRRAKRIVTLHRFAVLETLKGPVAETLEFLQAGGKLGPIDETILGLPVYRNGETVLLFLRDPVGAGGLSGPVGAFQGKFAVHTGSDGRFSFSNPLLASLQRQALRAHARRAVRTPAPFSRVLPDRLSLAELRAVIRQ